MDTSKKESGPGPTVSVVAVIKSGDEASFLSGLEKQTYSTPFEVIVVEGGTRSQARNFAIAESEAPLVAFIDADCEPEEDWLTIIVSALPSDQRVAGVGGVSSSLDSSTGLARAIDGVFSTYLGSLNSPSLISFRNTRRAFVRSLSGHNCIFRRSALIEVGGFDRRFELNEDTDLCARLREKGYKLLLDQYVSIWHKRRNNLRDFARQFFWYGIGRMRSMLTSRRYVDRRILGLLLVAVFFTFIIPLNLPSSLIALAIYLSLVIGNSVLVARRIRSTRLVPKMVTLFIVEHLSYLAGLLCGTFLGPWRGVGQTDSLRMVRYRIVSNTVVGMSSQDSKPNGLNSISSQTQFSTQFRIDS